MPRETGEDLGFGIPTPSLAGGEPRLEPSGDCIGKSGDSDEVDKGGGYH